MRLRAQYEFCLPIILHKMLYDEDLWDEDNKMRYLAFLWDSEKPLV